MAIYIIGKIKPKNDGKFALLDAADVDMGDGTRLSEKKILTEEEVNTLVNELFVPITQEEYDALVDAGTDDKSKYYMIVGDE